jgi:hypothetical protein
MLTMILVANALAKNHAKLGVPSAVFNQGVTDGPDGRRQAPPMPPGEGRYRRRIGIFVR